MRRLAVLRSGTRLLRQGAVLAAMVMGLAAVLVVALPTTTTQASAVCTEYDAATQVLDMYEGVKVLDVVYDPRNDTFWVRIVDRRGAVTDIPVRRDC